MKSSVKWSLVIILGLALMVTAVQARKYGKFNQKSDGAWLGVSIQTVDYNLAENFDLPVRYGVIINDVVSDGPADKAGIKKDDVIIEIQGDKITDADGLQDFLADADAGEIVSFKLVRDGKEITVDVKLQNRTEYSWKTAPEVKVFKKKVGRVPLAQHDYHFYSREKPQSYIGVQMNDLTEQLGEFFGVEDGKGVLIVKVEEDSPAEKAGLKAGDVVVESDKKSIDDTRELQRAVGRVEPGEQMQLTVLRDRRKRSITVEVGEADDRFFGSFVPDIISIPNMQLLEIPDISRLKGDLRAERGMWIDSEQLKAELDELRQELKELKKELRSFSRSRR